MHHVKLMIATAILIVIGIIFVSSGWDAQCETRVINSRGGDVEFIGIGALRYKYPGVFLTLGYLALLGALGCSIVCAVATSKMVMVVPSTPVVVPSTPVVTATATQ
jgi:hypothetical protein